MSTYTVHFFYNVNRHSYEEKTFSGTQAAAEYAALHAQHANGFAGVAVLDSNRRIIFEAWGRW